MPTAVVTGANSGIGNAFAQVLIREGYDVTAVDINVGEGLEALSCKTMQFDVTSPESIRSCVASYGDGPLDLLLNVAGIMVHPDEDSLTTVSLETLTKSFKINTFGPLLVAQAFLPNLLKSEKPKIGVVTSRFGSIADNSSGGSYAYRASKSAVNSVFKNLAVDLKGQGVVVVIMHPGIVRTPMTSMLREIPGSVGPMEAAEELWVVVKGKGLDETGRFWHRNGLELPW
ncbi:short-chain dehydrogenase/reductase family enzyme [Daldinia sp. FL1419]|nr:short-chain dehydrogenase/reductase family enzyme [Daldinia sp. FL1419]